MKFSSTKAAAAIVVLLLLIAIVPISIAVQWGGKTGQSLPEWELKWDYGNIDSPSEAAGVPDDEWVKIASGAARPLPPAGVTAAWLRFTLPAAEENSALLINKIYGNTVKAYMNNKLIYDSQEIINYNGSKALIPLSGKEGKSQLYLWSSGGDKGFGVEGSITAGSYGKLLAFYVKQDLVDIVIGAALLFMGVALMVCLVFLRLDFFKGGFLLVLVILSFGVLLITYSPFLPLIMGNGGRLTEICFDLALFTLLPAFTFYFEQIFGPGKHGWIIRLRKFQLGYSLFCLGFLILNAVLSFRLDSVYRFTTVDILGVMMIIQFLFLMYVAIHAALNGNRDALIFSVGFVVFAVMSLSELILYYASNERYHLFCWKWGVVVFILSLIVILGRRFASNYEQAVNYSQELEKFNNDLQRSEKMEIISELAASVAHEVRNPLQVTRGFLQILGERSAEKEKEYLHMALEELDRASVIITDFLTFAKPGMDTLDNFEVSRELEHVSGILVPLANLQGGTIELKLQSGLQVLGSTSKFKQAFINLIKNSIESLQENGLITIAAWRSGGHVVISVQDNGEGMKVSELARLGEPYYSNKTKGTGLGLMVTFRIIEAMNGSIHFQSKKGEGTEVIVKLPSSVKI
ncbi:sensor histidine kinase [Paenibacillus sp. HW567]|uniref:sensor histidine kinase n=1 Tax=Paenibacillus sp. HW567 TaxID=1034769 RepID=UPI00035EE933|nr:sensor histidine kinase [Paenibacillus sp. HW567]